MLNIKEQVDTFAKKFVPSYRFIRSQESTIDSSHLPQRELNINSIKVLNWNIAKNNYDKIWLKDFFNIVEYYQPDLIFLQEFRLELGRKKLGKWIGMNWSYAPNFIDAHHQSYSGIFTASTISPLTKKVLITRHYEPIIKTPKISLITEYPLFNNKTTILAINSHLINFVDLNKFKIQLHELEMVLSAHHGPLIFSGSQARN
ncbi:endonuclease/exonuclease/phosphatase family protein [Nostoc sp. UHCC 0702]|nr:endonuclease/exonuclease/phosphatase family protein [Nostoc sp. UHCC 0702]